MTTSNSSFGRMMCWLLRLDQQTMHAKRIIGRPSLNDKSVHRLGHAKKKKNKNTKEPCILSNPFPLQPSIPPHTLGMLLLFLLLCLRNRRQQRQAGTMDEILTKHKSRILLRIVSFFANCQFQLRRTYCDTPTTSSDPLHRHLPLRQTRGRQAAAQLLVHFTRRRNIFGNL